MRGCARGPIDRQRQRGVVLVSVLLIVLTVTSYVFLKSVNRQLGQPGYNAARTRAALAEAKSALIGYAVTYPDRVNAAYGPGYLLCPADGEDGVARSGCATSTHSLTGRFPWATLESNNIRDASGAQLWYALSENYRNNPHLVPLNSDTPGQIDVDGATDIVAVLIAPGPPLSGQDSRVASPNLVTNYLEDENATTGDQKFTRAGNGEFNDQLLVLTRQELMAAVEQRVLGEVAQRLNAYYWYAWDPTIADDERGYPWLSPYADPNTATFKAVIAAGPDGQQGQIPFHYAADPDPGPNEQRFATAMTVSWDLAGADEQTVYDTDTRNDIPTDCLKKSDCGGSDPYFSEFEPGHALSIPATVGHCTWSDPDVVDQDSPRARNYARCDGALTLLVPRDYELNSAPGTFVPGTLRRTYTIRGTFQDTEGVVVTPPTATGVRTRALATTSPADDHPGADDDHRIEIDIQQIHTADGILPPGEPFTVRSELIRVKANNGTSGSFRIAGVHYDLDVDEGELPGWFIANDWHHQVYVAYSEADEQGNTSTCDVTASCLTLQIQRRGMAAPVPQTNIRGLVLVAGAELAGAANPRVGGVATMASYFEAENDQETTPGRVYSLAPRSAVFNDQVRVLGTAP